MNEYKNLKTYFELNMDKDKSYKFYDELEYYIISDYRSSCEFTNDDIIFLESLGYLVDDFEVEEY